MSEVGLWNEIRVQRKVLWVRRSKGYKQQGRWRAWPRGVRQWWKFNHSTKHHCGCRSYRTFADTALCGEHFKEQIAVLERTRASPMEGT